MTQNTSSAVMQRRSEPHDSLDDFPTPPWATRALCEWMKSSRMRHGMVSCREPAANRGHMVKPLREYFQRVEYVRPGFPEVHTNTVEGFYSIFKRGMKGVYQHCAKKHLHRYAAEFDFRYNHRIANGVDDAERGKIALRNVIGKRLTYRRPDYAAAP